MLMQNYNPPCDLRLAIHSAVNFFAFIGIIEFFLNFFLMLVYSVNTNKYYEYNLGIWK